MLAKLCIVKQPVNNTSLYSPKPAMASALYFFPYQEPYTSLVPCTTFTADRMDQQAPIPVGCELYPKGKALLIPTFVVEITRAAFSSCCFPQELLLQSSPPVLLHLLLHELLFEIC